MQGLAQSIFRIQKTPFWRAQLFIRTLAVLLAVGLVFSIARPANAAITFRAASSGNNGAGATSLDIATPTGTLTGDVMIAVISVRGGTGTTITANGWTPINSNDSTTTLKSSTYYRVAGSSEGTHSFTFASQKASGVISSYSGVDIANPINAQDKVVNTSNTSMTAPTITTTVANAWVIAAYSTATGTTVSAGSSMNLREQDASTSNAATSRTTSGLQDILQAGAGATGAKTMTAGAAAVNIGHTIALTPAPAVTQVGYRWFANNTTAGTVGSPLANQDAVATAPVAGQPFRLRMLLGVADVQLPTSTAFKLQYKWESSGTCSSTGAFIDVTASTPIKYFDNTGVSDAASIVTSGSDPVRSGVTKVTQTYEELNNFTVATAIPVAQDGMWDFALTLDTSAKPEGIYCLKAVGSNGTAFSTYSAIPGIRALVPISKAVQGNYRFSQNADSLTPGSPLAATDTPTTLGAANDSFRLRTTAKGYRGFSQITSGLSHTCGIASDNLAYCWGSDASGQLGNGAESATQVRPVAVDTSGVLSGKTILSISARTDHTCAIASDNQAYCWGFDGNNELGNGATTSNQVSPVAVDTTGVLSGKSILSIAAGNSYGCVIASDNQAYCWGYGGNGQLGSGTTGNQASPVAVDTSGVFSGKTILSITAGSDGHTCAIASDNLAYCWGSDANGQLGNGATTGTQLSPVAVDTSGVFSGKTILSISAGDYHTCAIASDNLAYCWGFDDNGRLGNGATTGNQVSPVAVDASGVLSGKTILSITAGSAHTCAIASDNLAYCWGFDANGELGNGATTGDQVSPVAVDASGVLSGKTIERIAIGKFHTCAITSDNLAYCWGFGGNGQLGNGTTTGTNASPVAVSTAGVLSGKTILGISAGSAHTCALASDNQAYCWGSDSFGQLGNGAATSIQAIPSAVDTSGALSGNTILSVSSGSTHTCAIASNNLAYCWGSDGSGELGNGATTGNQVSPVAVDTSGVLSGKTILSIIAGPHTCAIASDNQAYCWGSDGSGQLGNGATTGNQVSPVAVDTTGVLSGKTILSISIGPNHTCAIASDNLAYCWGSDGSGQLGNGATTGNQVSPVAVDTTGVLSGKTILSISAGITHTCVLASDNQAYCWGSDSSGELGNGATTGNQVSPVAVDTTGVFSGKTILSISADGNHTCAIASDDQAYCWGFENTGQLGNGETTGNQVSPVAVDASGVLSGKTILSITLASNHTCALASDDQAYCWGLDNSGQLGNDRTLLDQPSPDGISQTIIGNFPFATSRLSLTVQYAQKTLASCSIQTGFASITAATPIAFNDNASATSGAAISTNTNDPVTSGGNIAQTYHDLVDTITNTTDVTGEGIGIWDFSLKDNGAPSGTTYCLRLADSDGSALRAYENYPEITTAPAPSVDPIKDMLRGGQSVIDGIKNAFSW